MLIRILMVALLCFFSINNALAQKVAISVDGSAITVTDVQNRTNLILLTLGFSKDESALRHLRENIYEVLIDEKLVSKEAKRLKINIEDEEVEDALKLVAKRNNVSKTQLEQDLIKRGVPKKELIKQIKHQLLWSKVIHLVIQPKIIITDQEIEENKASLEKLYSKASEIVQIKLAEIALFHTNEAEYKRNKVFTEDLIKQIQSGVDFGRAAKTFSQSYSSIKYGEIGWVTSNQIHPQLSKVLINLSVGGISEPMVLPDGIHIFKVLDRKVLSSQEKRLTNEEVREVLYNKKLDTFIKAYLRKLRSMAHIRFYSNLG